MAESKIALRKSTIVTVWTNPDPTVAFAAQTVSVDLSNYDMVFIIWGRDASASPLRINPSVFFKNDIGDVAIQGAITNLVDAGGHTGRRLYFVSKDGIEFQDGAVYTGTYGSGGVTNNGYFIPLYIIGIIS